MISLLTNVFNKLFCRRRRPAQPLPRPALPCFSNAATLMPNPTHPLDIAHHAMYGQPGEVPEIRTLPTSWQNVKPFQKPIAVPFPWNVELDGDQVTRLVMGFLPREMEDKWVVYSEDIDEGEGEGEGKLRISFHRSWTGQKITELWMEVDVSEREKGGERRYGAGRITGLVWEDRGEERDGVNWEGKKEIVREVCRWVLGVQLPDDVV